MANSQIGMWGRHVGSLVGLVLAGPGGAALGNLAGGLMGSFLPELPGALKSLLTNVTTEAVQKTGKKLIERLDSAEKIKINHDLQKAFRSAYREAVHDIGGATCFLEEWREKKREIPSEIVYASTPEANELWRTNDPLAVQICTCLHEMLEQLTAEKLLPNEPPKDQPAADVQKYLEIDKSWEMNQLFNEQVLGDFFTQYALLFSERPDFKHHLECHLLDRTLIHLGEILKVETPAWRAFNRLLLEGLRDEIGELGAEQAEIIERLDLLLAKESPAPLGQWSDGIATIVSSVGQLEKHLEDRLDEVLSQAVVRHSEVIERLDRLTVVGGRIESKVDRVLRFLEDGRYVIEGVAPLYSEMPPEPGEAPYKGLLYYQANEAELFFGREEYTAKLVGRLYQQRVLVVVGASGSGKSSLVRAGVIAALKRGEALADGNLPPPGSAAWLTHIITPTAYPLEALASALTYEDARASATETLLSDLRSNPHSLDWFVRKLLTTSNGNAANRCMLLVVDQFEELFTICKDPDERKAFIDNLVTATQAEGPLVLILVLRADFYAQAVQYEPLRNILEDNQVIIGPLSREELKRAIEEPAARRNWQYEAGLVDLILHDVGADPGREPEPGALPLLSHALLEAWKKRRGRTITLESYGESGGVRKAIAKTAENVYRQQLNEEQRTIARSVFLRLTELGEGTQDTRRRVAMNELVLDPQKQNEVDQVLKVLTDARLVTVDANSVEVAHEAVIREWPTLRDWLEEDRQALRTHRNLTEAAIEWQRLSKDVNMLYRGARLAEALEWLSAHQGDVNPLEAEFIEASHHEEQRQMEEREAQRQQQLEQARQLLNTQRQRALFLGIGLLVALILAGVAFAFSRKASENLDAAGIAGTLSAQNAGTAQAASTLSAAQEATAVAERQRAEVAQAEAETQQQLAQARLWAAQGQLLFDQNAQGPYINAVFAIESMRVSRSAEASSALLKSLELLPIPITSVVHGGPIRDIAFSPNGALVVSGSDDNTARVWEAATGREIAHMEHDQPVYAVAFSPDGRWVVSGSVDGTARVWDASSGNEVAQMIHNGEVWDVAFSPDGRMVVSGSEDGTARVWEAASGQEVARMQHDGWVTAVSFSPDGDWVLSGSDDYTARIWNATSGEEVARFQHDDWVTAAVFSPDGCCVATASYDNSARVWAVATGEELTRVTHDSNVFSVAFSPDGQWVASGSDDHTARVWWALRGDEISNIQFANEVRKVIFSPDGRWVITGSFDGTARVWEATTGEEVARRQYGDFVEAIAISPDGKWVASGSADGTAQVWEANATAYVSGAVHDGTVTRVAFNADGSRLVSGGWDGVVRVWEAGTGEIVSTLGHGDDNYPLNYVEAVSFSPDGQMLVSGSSDGTARIWETSTGEEVARFTHTGPVWDVAFSPDGRWVASGSEDGTARLWDVAASDELARIQHGTPVRDVAFSPDGRWVVSGDVGGLVRVWQATSGEETARMQHTGEVWTVAFSPDGSMVASGGSDGTILVWGADSGQEAVRMQHEGGVSAIAFSPDGLWVVSGSNDHTARIWDVSSGEEVARLRHADWVNTVAFSSDGQWVATGSWDGTARVWEASTGVEVARFVLNEAVFSVAFSPDSRWVATGGNDFMARVWIWQPEDLIAEACLRLPRNLSEEEWAQYFPGEEYRLTCPELGEP